MDWTLKARYPENGEALFVDIVLTHAPEHQILAVRESDEIHIEFRQKGTPIAMTRARLQYSTDQYRVARLAAARLPLKMNDAQLLSAFIALQFFSLQSDWTEIKKETAFSIQSHPFENALLIQPRAVNLLYGPGGSGKGMATLATILKYIHPIGQVHYFDWENQGLGRAIFWQRATEIAKRLKLPAEPPIESTIHYYSGTDPINRIVHGVLRILAKREPDKPCLVVLDSLSTALAESLNEQEHARRWMRFLNRLTNDDVTVLIQAHVSKQDIRGGTGHAGPLGSRIFQDLARNAWEIMPAPPELQKEPDTLQSILIHRKSNFAPLINTPYLFIYALDQVDFVPDLDGRISIGHATHAKLKPPNAGRGKANP